MICDIIGVMARPDLSFVIVFLLFSLLFIFNTLRLWINTEKYYQEVRTSLERTPIPFKSFFQRRMENRQRWELEQKLFSLLGLIAVIGVDVLVVQAYLR